MVRCVFSTGKKRPRRSCIVKARKVKREKSKEQINYYISLFFEDVYFYSVFMFKILNEIKNKTN